MPRHVHDDFSFLPTVDSTDEEVMEKQVLWKSGRDQPQPGAVVPEQPVDEAPPVISPPPLSVPAPLPAKRARVFEPDVSDAGPLPKAPAEPEQDGRALWEAFEKEQPSAVSTPGDIAAVMPGQPETEALLPAPPCVPEVVRLRDEKTRWPVQTPVVSFSSRRSVEKAPSATAPAPPAGKARMEVSSKTNEPADTLASPKPFIAPKPKPEEPEDPDMARKTRWRKLAEKIGVSSLGLSVGVHLFLLLIAAFVGVTQVMERQVDFLPGGSSPQSEAAAENLAQKIQQKKNPWLKAKPRMQKVTAQTIAADIVLPEMPPMDMMDFSNITNRMDISKAASMGAGQPMGMGTGGAGGGFGAGIGRGGKFSFVGQTAIGRRVVFVVDVSGSMSQPLKGEGQRVTRFDLLKKELIKAVKQIPTGTAYQILYFSDFAWPHNQVDSRNGNELEKYRWNIKPDDYKQVKIPTFKYLQASPFTIQDSVEIIQRSENPGLTNWGAGLLMALNANPKPDVIFFMTDGERQDEMGWIDIVTAENKRKLPMAVIHTSVMAQVDAAREMDDLARRNNGKFTVVMGEGKVIKGEDFFKMR